ncbi:MAG: MAPEG family protein, partial [Pseudomonadota bacterium]
PSALLAIGILTFLGYGAIWIHGLGAVLLGARLCHAHGIQQPGPGLPATRVLGNIITWLLFLVVSVMLVIAFFL